jgi:voltage-gated potassium channel
MSTWQRAWVRPVLSFVGLLVVFYAFPANLEASTGGIVLSGLAVAVGLAVLGWTMVMELEHLRRGEDSRGTVALALLLVLLVVAFSAPSTFFTARTRMRSWACTPVLMRSTSP